MTSQDKIKKFGWITTISSLFVVIVYLYLVGLTKDPIDLLKLTGVLSLSSVAVFFLVNNILWKTRWINSFFGSIPDLNGTWTATIINNKDKISQEANIKITQTWLNIKVSTKAERGNSSTISSEIINTNDTWRLYFVWKASFDGNPFDGTTIVTFFDNELDGHYFTNRSNDDTGCTSGSFIAKKQGQPA